MDKQFGLSHIVTLGRAKEFQMNYTTIGPCRFDYLFSNVPSGLYVTADGFFVQKINCLIGPMDLSFFNPGIHGSRPLGFPAVGRLQTIAVPCKYNGAVPRGYVKGDEFIVKMEGWARKGTTVEELVLAVRRSFHAYPVDTPRRKP